MSAADLRRLLAYELLNEALCDSPRSAQEATADRASAALGAVADWLRDEATRRAELAEEPGRLSAAARKGYEAAALTIESLYRELRYELTHPAAASPAGAAPVSAPTSAPDGGGAAFPSAPPP